MHHERPEGRHHLDDARRRRCLELLRQRQHKRAQVGIDTVAELHDQGRIAGGEKAGLWGDGMRLSLVCVWASVGWPVSRRPWPHRRAAASYGLPIDSTNCALSQRGA